MLDDVPRNRRGVSVLQRYHARRDDAPGVHVHDPGVYPVPGQTTPATESGRDTTDDDIATDIATDDDDGVSSVVRFAPN